MPRRLILLLAAASLLPAAIWPEQWGVHKRSAIETLQLPDAGVWEEYGLEAAERAVYPQFRATGYRLKDSTAALGVFQWLKPAGGQKSDLEENAVQAGSRLFAQRGNYIIDIDGRIPTREDLDLLYVQLPRLDNSALPLLPGYLPKSGLKAGSERYIIGPASLEKFYPGVTPSVAAFSMGAEAQVAHYATPRGEMRLAIFSYPTPQIARERAAEFQKFSTAKRTGSLVAVIVNPPDADEAEKLLAKVNFQASITWNEEIAGPEQNPGDFLIAVFVLIGIMILFAIIGGAGFAGLKLGWRRLTGGKTEDEGMLTLHLDDKSTHKS
jgi:hypothetical protein